MGRWDSIASGGLARATLGVALLCGVSACSVDDVVGLRIRPNSGVEAGAGAFDAGSTGACSGSLFCSSFDQGLDSYDTVQNGGTLSVAPPGFDDRAALYPQTAEGSGQAYIRTNLGTPAITELHLRAYLWVASAAPVQRIAIFFLGPAGGFAGINVNLYSDSQFELFLPEHQVSLYSELGAFSREQWHCLQLMLVVDEVDGQATLSVDGQAVVSETALDTDPGEDFDLFTLGIVWSAADQEPVQVSLDDVILSQSPVGCL